MTVLTEALAAAQRRADELLPMLRRWVETNSYSGNVDGVNAVGTMLAEDFDLAGLALERHAGDGVGDHLIWRTSAWAEAGPERLLLIGHHDTVFPQGTFDVWDIEGDRLRGPGVLDMKGGLLVVRTALACLDEVGALADLPISVASVGDEEIGSNHSRPVLEDLARGAGAALVFEAGRAQDMIVTQRKGTGRLMVSVKGVAAHAGNHHPDGVNAIWALARFVDRVQALTDYDLGVTVNVGLISGGSSANTVPANAECTIDFRYERAADGHAVVAAADVAAREVGAESGAAFTLAGGIRRAPLERTDASVALFRRYAECAGASGLGNAECPLMGGGSDANTVSAVGVAAIDGLGPRGKGFHTHDEYIEVSSLAMRIEALIRFLLS
jgi:glutamate carboxypeptidase